MFEYNKLYTPFEISSGEVWGEVYPRPQMARDSFFSLCGTWRLSVGSDGKESYLGDIQVPFPPESRLSGIERALGEREVYLYDRMFLLPESFSVGRVLLHFGAVDQIARVYFNGYFLGEHIGGYLPFSFDVTDQIHLKEENHIRVEVSDPLDTELAYGKQRKDRGGMWYTPISGIWQTVWMESVPENYIHGIQIASDAKSVTVSLSAPDEEKKLFIETEEGTKTYSFVSDSITVPISKPHLWSPEDPHLYHFTLECGSDRIRSYFALRSISTERVGEKVYLTLNGKPYFFHGLLDQGYYPDGIYLPASPYGYLWDIENVKKLGFNTLRKHIKIEPELFYYYCDKLGMIVFQDMVNSGKYSFILDTALPTIGLRKGICHKASKRRREQFERDCEETVELLYNHPSVLYYTIFNEGWGQYDADRLYGKMKKKDPTRIWDATSGWFREKLSDVVSEHIYFRRLNLKNDGERPLVLSEFGGYSCNIQGHLFNDKNQYGYKSFRDTKEFTQGLSRLYRNEVIPMIEKEGLSAAILTQLSDVEDETNGLASYDRKVIKCDENTMQLIASELREAFEKVSVKE
ncbi:MAG: glycoside hydrolase family 2 [Clostridia bacterium]|nr:glycoside hydrolase family 2 [Clostridia bacterium]